MSFKIPLRDQIVIEILELTSDPESDLFSLVSFPTKNSALFNAPVATDISMYLTDMNIAVTVDTVNDNLIEWQYDEELATGRDPRD